MRSNNSLLWEQFNSQRDRVIRRLSDRLSSSMAALVGHAETADLVLVAADGSKVPAHACILRQRAPVFFDRYISGPLVARRPRSGQTAGSSHGSSTAPLEVAIGEVDFAGLSFFIRSVYTDEEITTFGGFLDRPRDREEPGSSGGQDDENDHLENDRHSEGAPSPRASPRASPHSSPRRQPNRSNGNGSPRSGDADSLGGDVEAATPRSSVTMSGSSPSTEMTSSRPPTAPGTNWRGNSRYQVPERESSSPPMMTTFRELASSMDSSSPMCWSGYSERSQYDIVEEDETNTSDGDGGNENAPPASGDSSSRFQRLDDSGIASLSRTGSPVKRKTSTKIFPMFIGLGGDSDMMTQSLPESVYYASQNTGSLNTLSTGGSIRGRAMLAKRLSVTSLTSLTSLDLTPTTEPLGSVGDKLPCSRLAADLLEMYTKSVDTDVVVTTASGDLHAHKCILWATCPAFRKVLKKSNKIELRGFTHNAIDFLLTFLYGGVTCIPDDVEIWELVSLATHLDLEELAQVAQLHLKTHKCHFFHRPCATCVSAVFDSLPQFKSVKCLAPLYDEAMQWQARHFSRIWKGRVFLHLDEQWQRECCDTLVAEITEETIIDALLGCEKLQASLPRIKAQQLADTVQGLVADVIGYCTDFLISSFDLVVGSKAFKSHGKGLALNLALLEDILPSLIHSLSADTAIKTFMTLKEVLIEVEHARATSMAEQSPKRSRDRLNIPISDYSQRFIHLVHKLLDSTNKHLLHYAFSVVKCDAWNLLTPEDQEHIRESGIFVEMKMPRAPPPRLSSFNRTYKRSSSVGFTEHAAGRHDRTRSLERPRPIISQVIEASEKEELAREKSFTEMHKRALSLKDRRERAVLPTAAPPAGSLSKIPHPAATKHTPGKLETVPVKPQQAENARTPEKKKAPLKKGPPPVKRPNKRPTPAQTGTSQTPAAAATVAASEGEFSLERQNTHTIMTVQQHKESGIDPRDRGVPVLDSPKLKPKSVVRPMPKHPSLASSAPANVLPKATKPPPTTTTTQSGRPASSKTTSSSAREEPKTTRASSAKTTTTTPSTTTTKSALPTRSTRPSTLRSSAVTDRSKQASSRHTVESKIPKVRA